MSDRDTRASGNLKHLTVTDVLNLPLRVRGRGSRSPSPAPAPGTAFFPTAAPTAAEDNGEETFSDANEVNMPTIPADAAPEEIRRMAEQAQQEARNMRIQQDRMTAALEAATQAAAAATAALQALALSNNSLAAPIATVPRRKRPELPALDKNNIHIWIQRVESAYAREEVTDPKQKFAFLESIIGVNLGPTINNFMFGEASAENWTGFLEHLKDVYGPTKETRCSVYLDGMKRNSLRPSDHLALIRDRAKDVSIDDLQKQLILRGLPSDVRKLVQDKVEKLDAVATASLADAHFGKDGQPLNSSSSVNNVSQQQPQHLTRSTSAPADDLFVGDNMSCEDQTQEPLSDTNAVPGRFSRAPRRSNNGYSNNKGGGNSTSRGHFTPAFQSGSSQPRTRTTSRPNQTNNHSAPPTASSDDRQYSNCKLHAADPNSQVCNGPLCPLHARAKLCYSRRCTAHGQGGNDRGGRR